MPRRSKRSAKAGVSSVAGGEFCLWPTRDLEDPKKQKARPRVTTGCGDAGKGFSVTQNGSVDYFILDSR
jgi:hypothetical protein